MKSNTVGTTEVKVCGENVSLLRKQSQRSRNLLKEVHGILLHRSARIHTVENVVDRETGEIIKKDKYVRKDLYQLRVGEKFILIETDGSLCGLYTATDKPFEVALKNKTSTCVGVQTSEGLIYSVDPEVFPIEDKQS